MKSLLPALALCLAPAAFASSVILHDDFSGSVVDTSKWTVIKPDTFSSISQSGGKLTTYSRGTLATAAGVSAPYTVAGSFTSFSSDELFTVTLRSDLSQTPNFFGRQGVSVTFSNTGDNVSIYAIDGGGIFTELTATTPYSFTTGAAYAFEIADDGFNIAVSVNGSQVASASSSLALGDRVAFYSREWMATGSSIDSITITSSAIPEPSTYAALAGLFVLALATMRRRHQAV